MTPLPPIEVPHLSGLTFAPGGEECFASAPCLAFAQAWREAPEPELAPGTVRMAWNEAGFWVLATLEDACVFTRAESDQQRLWTLGDVFEIFLRDLAGEEYLELHTAPNGCRLQLRFASGRVIEQMRDGEAVFEDALAREECFRSEVRLVAGGWQVLACVPVTGRRLKVSFGRYDYRDAETPPVLSSTSPHAELNYHRQHEWREVVLIETR